MIRSTRHGNNLGWVDDLLFFILLKPLHYLVNLEHHHVRCPPSRMRLPKRSRAVICTVYCCFEKAIHGLTIVPALSPHTSANETVDANAMGAATTLTLWEPAADSVHATERIWSASTSAM